MQPTLGMVDNDNPWPHRLAIVVACATFPLIWVGGLVTTYDAGMAVPDWPSTFGYNLFLYPWQTWITGPFDLFIEHGHRLLGALVGMLTMGLVAVTWKFESRRWVRWFSLVCLAGVISQGVLGGMRVLLDERTLAKIHACTGPLFFALAMAMVVVTSKRWRNLDYRIVTSSRPNIHTKLTSLAGIVAFLTFAQIVVGAQLRHITFATTHSFFRMAVFFHVAIAALLFVQTMLLAIRCWRQPQQVLRRRGLILLVLISAQIGLGIASWIVNYGPPAFLGESWMIGYTVAAKTLTQAMIVTAHVAIGSSILVTSLTVAMHTARLQWTGKREYRADTPSQAASRPESTASLNLEAVG